MQIIKPWFSDDWLWGVKMFKRYNRYYLNFVFRYLLASIFTVWTVPPDGIFDKNKFEMFQTIISFINLITPVFKLTYVQYIKLKARYVYLNISCLKAVLKHIYTYATFIWPLRWKSWKSKMTEHPVLTFIQSFVKFPNIDLEIQMKVDVLYHIFIYATFVWLLRWKSWKGKMTAYPILMFVQSFIKFQCTVQEIEIELSVSYLLTYLLTYILTYILYYIHKYK